MDYEKQLLQDIDALDGERWFPKESEFEDDLPLYWGDWGVYSECLDLKDCLMRRPGKEVENFDWQASRFFAPIDPEKFREQHDNLAQIYKDNGVRVHYVEEQREDRPNAIFCRDLCFMTPEGAIVTRPGMAARRGEERYVAKKLSDIGVPIIHTINGDGRFEGANAMWVDRHTCIISTGARTNRSGAEQVEHELRRMGVDNIIWMQIPYGHAHIDGLLNFASEDTAMIFSAQVPFDVCYALQKKGVRLLECPSRTEAKLTAAINYVAIKPGVVVQCEGNPRSKEVLEKAGIKVISIDFSEVLKGYGAMHCCTAFLKRG